MIGSSKILTVSYGTFSCTLEGFEDSFSTMKAIAEYFRDLAADDRYFGAEPPTPDAEMLARIAEREIARRVEARTEGEGIVLRASEALDAPAASNAPAAETEQNAIGEAAGDDASPLLAAADPVAAEAETAEAAPAAMHEARTAPAAPLDDDSVAAKLQRIRAVVDRNTAAPLTGVADFAEEDEAEEEFEPVADDAPDFAAEAEDDPVVAEEEVEAAELEEAEDELAEFEEAAEDRAAEAEEEVEELIAEAEEEADELAADDEDEAEELTAEAEGEEDSAAEDEADDIAAFFQDSADAEAVAEEDEAADEDAHVDLAAFVALNDAPAEPVEEAIAEAAEEELSDEDWDAEDWDEEEWQEVTSEAAEEDEGAPTMEAEEAEEEEDNAFTAMEEAEADDDEMADEEEDALIAMAISEEDEAEEDSAEAEEAVDDWAEEATDEDDEAEVEAWADEAEDDEAELDEAEAEEAEEMAEAEDEPMLYSAAETGEDGEALMDRLAATADDLHEDEEPRHSRAGLLGSRPDADEAAMDRMISRTDSELNTDEANRRREALAQLKAAVAATEAARRLGEAGGADGETENAFRNDLRQVVRPRRATSSGEGRSERPRPAPLKLVAAQRVDIDPAEQQAEAASAEPVMPRRVTVNELMDGADASGDAGNFAEFAREAGAHDLPDLLEAAAAYVAFVEGRDDFSRPQLMSRVRDSGFGTHSREDELRSFGTLLREGRIMKVRNGRFQVSEQSRFKPELRAG